MFNPLRRLKYLPWVELLQVGLITVVVASVIDVLLYQLLLLPAVTMIAARILNSPFGILLGFAAAIGVGALGVAILERWFRRVMITSSSLWALVPCLALWLWLRSLLPLGSLLLPALGLEAIVCLILGVFWKGRPYWR